MGQNANVGFGRTTQILPKTTSHTSSSKLKSSTDSTKQQHSRTTSKNILEGQKRAKDCTEYPREDTPALGPPCSCCCVKNTPLPLLTFQTCLYCFCLLFCAVLATFCCFLMLAFRVVCCFSCCSCLLLLPLLAVCLLPLSLLLYFLLFFAALVAALLLLLLRVLSGRRPLKSQYRQMLSQLVVKKLLLPFWKVKHCKGGGREGGFDSRQKQAQAAKNSGSSKPQQEHQQQEKQQNRNSTTTTQKTVKVGRRLPVEFSFGCVQGFFFSGYKQNLQQLVIDFFGSLMEWG